MFTTDIMHVLVCAHGHLLVMGSTGVGQRLTQDPLQKLEIFGHAVLPSGSEFLPLGRNSYLFPKVGRNKVGI